VAGRRVRTTAGAKRYNKPIGALIGGRQYFDPQKSLTRGGVPRVKAELDPDDRPRRAKDTPGQRARERRGRVRELDQNYRKFYRGDITRAEKESISYQSPDLRRKSKLERGTVVRPRDVTLRQARERRHAARDVRRNPLSGNYVAVPAPIGSRRGIKGGSVIKARKAAIRKPEYVGRRRRED
jgi:hypothetical protein